MPMANDSTAENMATGQGSTPIQLATDIGQINGKLVSDLSDRELLLSMFNSVSSVETKVDKALQGLSGLDNRISDLEFGLQQIDMENQDQRVDMDTIKETISANEQLINGIETRLHRYENQLTNIENHTRMKNALFFGIPDENRESISSTEIKVRQLIKDQLRMDNSEATMPFDETIRLGTVSADRQRPILVKFTRQGQRNEVLSHARKLLRGTPFRVGEDLTHRPWARYDPRAPPPTS